MNLSEARWVGDNWIGDLEELKGLQKLPGMNKTELQKQREHVLQTNMHPLPCPLCGVNVGSMDTEIECPGCSIDLLREVPFINTGGPSWYWILSDHAQETLLKLWKDR